MLAIIQLRISYLLPEKVNIKICKVVNLSAILYGCKNWALTF
jgi:hypothetical protein